jgi:CRISPR-associated exonuclease Cas4
MIKTEIDYISIASLNQYNYCAHRCWRMFCAGEFVDNQYTIEGTSLHDRVHTVGDSHREEIGKADLIEEQDGRIYPVEYKRSAKGEFANDELQVCAQALCLEEMTGKQIDRGYVYYFQSHQRQLVELTPILRDSTIRSIESVRQLLATGKMPTPIYTPRCQGCSLQTQCLPKAATKVTKYQED